MQNEMVRHRPWKRCGAGRQPFADRAVAHCLNARDALAESGFTKFVFALAMLIDELLFVGRDPNVVDDALREAREIATLVAK